MKRPDWITWDRRRINQVLNRHEFAWIAKDQAVPSSREMYRDGIDLLQAWLKSMR